MRRCALAKIKKVHWSANVETKVMLTQLRLSDAIEVVEECVRILGLIDELNEASAMVVV